MIVCKIIKENELYKLMACEDDKKVTLCYKETQLEALEYASALLSFNRIHAVELNGVLIL